MKRDISKLCLSPEALHPGNRVHVLRDGAEAYPRMLGAIRRAEKSILLEMYTFAEDAVGIKFAEALVERAQAGVDVRLLYDAMGSRETTREFFGSLRRGGILVREFNPVLLYFEGIHARRRNHRKLLVVDGRVSFVGGLNITREYAPPKKGGLGWRDTQVELKGPVVAELAIMFQDLWKRARGYRRAPIPEIVPLEPREDGTNALVLSSHKLRRRMEIGKSYRYALRKARKRIWIANAYFLPSSSFRRELRKAVRRGVDVRVIVPSQTDFAPVLFASQRSFQRYLRWGVRLFEWNGPMMHAKTAVVDGTWSTVGSYNLDHLSLFHNYELTAIIVDLEVGRKMEVMFEKDCENCREIHLEEWRHRGWSRRWMEEVCYLFRTLF